MQRFARVWPALSVNHRRRVLRALVEIAEASFAANFDTIFRYCLNDEDDESRASAIEGLWEAEDAALGDYLLRALRSDPSERVRAAAAISMGRFVLLAELGKSAHPSKEQLSRALRATIADSQEALDVRRRAVEAIAYSDEPGMRQLIEAAYRDGAEKMRVSAVFAMGRSADAHWCPLVERELSSSNPEMRYEAARSCGELQDAKAVPALVGLIRDPDREVQGAAIWALGQIGGEAARRALERCRDGDDELRADAAEEALAELELGTVPLNLLVYEPDEDEEDFDEGDL
jgi:HEAT repeat protein